MPFFVIAGLPDCRYLAQAVYIANYLQDSLPNFCVKIIRKNARSWAKLLLYVNKHEKWCHTTSPIIWKELCRSGSKPYLIGGLSEFWEYIDDYYGLQAKIPKEMIESLISESVEAYKTSQQMMKNTFQHYVNILITGAMSKLILTLLPELIGMNSFSEVHIYLHDRDPDFLTSDFMNDVIEDVTNICYTVTLVQSMQECLSKIDLFIIIEDMGKKPNEENDRFLARNIAFMNFVGDLLNTFAKKSIKILISQSGPACLNATALCENCAQAKSKNIVVVTNDLGLAPIAKLCTAANIDIANVGGPPVWGFTGFNTFIDLSRAVMKADVYRPYDRAIRSTPNSSLPLGIVHSELRYMEHILEELEDYEDEPESTDNIVEMFENLPTSSYYARTRAIISVLKNWYSNVPTNDVISLGIKSQGDAFNIPLGMVFSQPCICNDGIWEPYIEYPMPRELQRKIDDLILPAKNLCEEFGFLDLGIASIYRISI